MKLLQILPALVLWSVVVTRIIGLRFGWKSGILRAMVLVSIGTTLNIDPAYSVVDELLGNRNILNLIVHVALGLGMTELSRLIVAATDASIPRWRLLVLMGGVLAVAQAALLFSTRTPGSATNFTDVFARDPAIAWYQGLFFSWIGLITAWQIASVGTAGLDSWYWDSGNVVPALRWSARGRHHVLGGVYSQWSGWARALSSRSCRMSTSPRLSWRALLASRFTIESAATRSGRASTQ